MYTETNSSDVGVADYYNRKPNRPTSRLVALAPHVLLIARCEGAPEAARYFTERLECKVTEKMVKTIKAKVARGTLLVTREELTEAALSHPTMAARMAREPSLCDPQHYRAAITPEPEQEEIDLKFAKKAAKKAANKVAKKKAVEKLPEKPKPIEIESSQKTAEDVQAKAAPKHLTKEEMLEAAALLDADDAEDEDLYS